MDDDYQGLAKGAKTTAKAAKGTVKAGRRIWKFAAWLVGLIGVPGLVLLVILLGVVAVLASVGTANNNSSSGGAAALSAQVQAYQNTILDACNEYGLDVQYITLVQAVMMQESGGDGLDPMQASESGYNTLYPRGPNGIMDPKYSIECGVQALRDCINAAGVAAYDDFEHIPLALQGYNYGGGYITWALENYGGYTHDNAVLFSEQKKAELGWSAYGDVDYVDHVLRYYAYYAQESESGYIMPLPAGSYTVSDWYGERTLNGKTSFHKGIDFAAAAATEIYAVTDGWVTFAGSDNSGYGTYVVQTDSSGREIYYGHMSSLAVARDQQVRQGQIIGYVGSTGDSTGNHLHFEVRDTGTAIDPLDLLPMTKDE